MTGAQCGLLCLAWNYRLTGGLPNSSAGCQAAPMVQNLDAQPAGPRLNGDIP
ncbi:Uncharacterised protein [Bordetella pertussis]|nr:Uncharacterised protein [Bordetella pertussis]